MPSQLATTWGYAAVAKTTATYPGRITEHVQPMASGLEVVSVEVAFPGQSLFGQSTHDKILAVYTAAGGEWSVMRRGELLHDGRSGSDLAAFSPGTAGIEAIVVIVLSVLGIALSRPSTVVLGFLALALFGGSLLLLYAILGRHKC